MCIADVLGRGEYLNEKIASYFAVSSSESVSAKSASVSPGNPTMMSDVMLIGRRARVSTRSSEDTLRACKCAAFRARLASNRTAPADARGRKAPALHQSHPRSNDE